MNERNGWRRFLSKGGIDISVLAFHGFEHEGETLLARQVEVERDADRTHRAANLPERRRAPP